MSVIVPVGARSVEVQATVIRADGTREELGTVGYWHKSPLRRLAWALRRRLARLLPRVRA